MHLIQVFLPLWDNNGRRFSRDHYEKVERELVVQFEGFTAYPRAPASGLWKSDDATIQRDELVVYEIMTGSLDRNWWREFRGRLEELFEQDRILARSHTAELL